MKNEEESSSVIKDYFGFDARSLAIFFGLVIGVILVVTGIYVAVFGFESWSTNMEQAGTLLLTAAPVDASGAGAGQPGAPSYSMGNGPAAAQYRCPNCGGMCAPLRDQAGTPYCPGCNTPMQAIGQAGGSPQLVATRP